MKRFALLSLALGAMFFIPTGAFARDKHHHHKHHDRDYRDYHDWSYNKYRGDDRDYYERQRDIERDRLQNGYNRDGTPRYQYYPRYYYRR